MLIAMQLNAYLQIQTYLLILLTHTNEESQPTTYTYDRENRRTSETFAGETTQRTYDSVGNPASIIRPKGNVRKMDYDGFKRLTTVIDDAFGLKLTTSYVYDPNNNLTTQFDPRSGRTSFFYDELNRKVQESKSAFITRYGYDEEGNRTWIKDANGQTTTYTYDEINRLSTAVYAEQTIDYGYDPNNNLTSVTENKLQAGITDTTINTYDTFDRPETSTQRGLLVSYAYDKNGNRTRVATAAAATDYTFDGKNRLKTATSAGQTTTYTYTPAGKKDTIAYPNGTSVQYTYYDTNRIRTIENKSGATLISSYAYEYDSNGNRTKQTEVQNGTSETTDYTYDTLDRLTAWTIAGKTKTTYTYVGYNRKTETVYSLNPETLTRNLTYDYDETDRLTRTTDSVNGKIIAYTYDNNGNTLKRTDSLLPDQETTFTYDSRDQLTQTKRGPPGAEVILGKYDYNYAGMRVRHLYSDRGNIDYYYDGKSVIEERNAADNSLVAHYDYADRLLSLRTSVAAQFFHHDALGSTVNLTDAAGAIQVSYLLDPWGHIRSQSGTSVNRKIFTGHEHDANTGLVYFKARYYDPDTGRFITQDPYLGETSTPPSLHRYLYAYSNPTVYVDLEGYESEEVDKKGNVFWIVEKDGPLFFDTEVRRVKIGTKKDDKVELTQEFGGGIVAHEKLKKEIADFWKRGNTNSVMNRADISIYESDYQNQLIREYIDEKMNPHGEERISAIPQESFLKRSGNQLIKGEYSADVTWLGTAAQIGTGILGIDAPADIRDLKYNLDHWENSWSHAGKTLLTGAGLLPVVGGIKNIKSAPKLLKQTEKVRESVDYREIFFKDNPELIGKVKVHHGIEQQVLNRPAYSELFTESEIHALENLRGIPNELNSSVHLSKIRIEWNRFYRENPSATKEQFLQKRLEIDLKYGDQFKPPVKP